MDPADSGSEDEIVNNLVEEIHQQSSHYSARDGQIWSKEPIAQHATGRVQVHNLVREQHGPTREVLRICANIPADSFKVFLTPEIVNIIVQETKWKGERACELGDRFKIFYYGMDAKRNGVGVVVDPELRSVLSVERKSDRMIWVKLAVDKQIINIASVYAPQTGCEEEEKDKFWNQLGDTIMAIPESEQLWIGGDLNGHVGEGNAGHEACIGRHGFDEKEQTRRHEYQFCNSRWACHH